MLGRVLAKVTAKECPDRLERLWTDRQKEDCYFTTFELKDEPLAVVFGYSDGVVLVKCVIDGKYGDEVRWPLDGIPLGSLRILHYYRGATVSFRGTHDWLITAAFPWRYVRIRLHHSFDALFQERFNRKKIVTEARMKILGVLIRDYLDGRVDKCCVIDLARRLYSNRVFQRPDSDQQIEKLRRILESLRDSGYLQTDKQDYWPTGQGISVYEQHEEEERRHQQVVWIQWFVAALTFIIALATAVQAGAIRIPMLLDLT